MEIKLHGITFSSINKKVTVPNLGMSLSPSAHEWAFEVCDQRRKKSKKNSGIFRVSIQRSCHSLMCSGANWLSFKFCRLSASVVRNFPWSVYFFTFVFPEEPFIFKIFNFFYHSGYVITIF